MDSARMEQFTTLRNSKNVCVYCVEYVEHEPLLPPPARAFGPAVPNPQVALPKPGFPEGVHNHARRYGREGHARSGGVVPTHPPRAHLEPLQLRHSGGGQGRDGRVWVDAGLHVFGRGHRGRYQLHGAFLRLFLFLFQLFTYIYIFGWGLSMMLAWEHARRL